MSPHLWLSVRRKLDVDLDLYEDEAIAGTGRVEDVTGLEIVIAVGGLEMDVLAVVLLFRVDVEGLVFVGEGLCVQDGFDEGVGIVLAGETQAGLSRCVERHLEKEAVGRRGLQLIAKLLFLALLDISAIDQFVALYLAHVERRFVDEFHAAVLNQFVVAMVIQEVEQVLQREVEMVGLLGDDIGILRGHCGGVGDGVGIVGSASLRGVRRAGCPDGSAKGDGYAVVDGKQSSFHRCWNVDGLMDDLQEAVAQVALSADIDDLADHRVHDGHLGHEIGGIVRTEHHETERIDSDAVVFLKHITVEILLQTVMIERGVGQVEASDIGLAAKGLGDGLAEGVDHLLAALPVVDGEGAVGLATDHVDGASDVHIEVEDGPLLTIGADLIVANETEELLFLALDGYLFGLTVIAEGADGVEGAVAEPVFGLFVNERAYLAGHAADTLPLRQRLLDGDTVLLPLAHGLCMGVEGFEKITYQRTDGQQLLAAVVEIHMALGLKVDMSVLLVQAGIGKSGHLLFYISHFECKDTK